MGINSNNFHEPTENITELELSVLNGGEAPAALFPSSTLYLRHLLTNYGSRPIMEIDQEGKCRLAQLRYLWSQAQRLAQHAKKHQELIEKRWILCAESFCDLISANWATMAIGIDSYTWHLHQVDLISRKDFLEELSRLRRSLGDAVLVTTMSIAQKYTLNKNNTPGLLILERLPPVVKQDYSYLTEEDRGYVFIKTSGTGGQEKIAVIKRSVISARNLVGMVDTTLLRTANWAPLGNITSNRLLLPTAPFTLLIHPVFFARQTKEAIGLLNDYQIQTVGLSTSITKVLLQALEDYPMLRLPDLKCLNYGLEPISLPTVRGFVDILQVRGASAIQVTFGYGMTEVGLIAFSKSYNQEELRALANHSDIPPLEECRYGVKIKICNEENESVSHGKKGEIHVLAPTRYIEGYLLPDGALQSIEYKDGWFSTGDIGMVTEEGLWVTGRAKDMIIVDGKNIDLGRVEQRLNKSDYILHGNVGAVPLLDTGNAGSYLLFFCLKSTDETERRLHIEELHRMASQEIGVAPTKSIAISEREVHLTPTGKLFKHAIARNLMEREVIIHHTLNQKGELPDSEAIGKVWINPQRAKIAEAYIEVLRLGSVPTAASHFFQDGGSSFLAVQFLTKINTNFQVKIFLSDFFSDPTLKNVWQLIEQARIRSNSEILVSGSYIDRMRSFLEDWPGEKLGPKGLLRGMNVSGSKPPLFWVFNDREEFVEISKTLGTDQPVYGMRSFSEICAISNLEERKISEVTNLYVKEILTLTRGGVSHYFIGGNCQAGPLAFWMVKDLGQMGCRPRALFLMEWSYDWGPCELDTSFFYGLESHTRPYYESESPVNYGGLPWRESFPNHRATAINGGHGQFFIEPNVKSLADALNSEMDYYLKDGK
jgi:acyl-CoA synthetase (AMP-forming)/AMP-acid ligase II